MSSCSDGDDPRVRGQRPGRRSGRFTYDGIDVTGFFLNCRCGTQTGGGFTFRCSPPGNLLGTGSHVLQVEDGSRRRNAIQWVVVSNTEP